MINSNTSFGKLKDVVVGVELEIPKRLCDFTFKHFYQTNLNDSVYDKQIVGKEEYYVNHDILQTRIEQLNDLADKLTYLGVNVHRPEIVDKVIPFKTPTFSSEMSAASNVRDVTIIYKDMIVETPTYVCNRYFENLAMYDLFLKATEYGDAGKWMRCPHTNLNKESIDLGSWNNTRDYNNFDKSRYAMAIDGAQFLRIGKDVIVNINSYNHYMGYLWVKSLYPDSNFHIVNIVDNHIDGSLICLKPGEFLVSPLYVDRLKEQLPEKFKNWNFIVPDDRDVSPIKQGMTDLDVQLASSRGMDINVLSIDENTVLVNADAVNVISALEKKGYDVITTQLDNCEIFGGGIHCSTLDLNREDEYIDYTE